MTSDEKIDAVVAALAALAAELDPTPERMGQLTPAMKAGRAVRKALRDGGVWPKP